MVCLAPQSDRVRSGRAHAVAKRVDRDGDGAFSSVKEDNFYYLTDVMFSVRALADSSGLSHTRPDDTPYRVAMHGKAADINSNIQCLAGLSALSRRLRSGSLPRVEFGQKPPGTPCISNSSS